MICSEYSGLENQGLRRFLFFVFLAGGGCTACFVQSAWVLPMQFKTTARQRRRTMCGASAVDVWQRHGGLTAESSGGF